MKNFCCILIVSGSLGLVAFAQEKNSVTLPSLVELIVNAEKFDGQKVAVMGFLVIGRERNLVRSLLYLHEEDAKNNLPNNVVIIASDEMIKDEEKINNLYVRITGRVRVTPTTGGGRIVGIREIESCVRWPPPAPRQ